MKIELRIDGETRIFTIPFVSARHFRKLMEYDSTIDYTDITVPDADELVGYVCDVFGNQFSVDQFYDGVPSHKLIEYIFDVFFFVRTGEVPKPIADDDPGNDQGK